MLRAEGQCVIDPPTTFRPNIDCPARGQLGDGNIRIHRHQRQRYRCMVCKHTCSSRRGTICFRRRTDDQRITQVVPLVSHGCPMPAIEVAFERHAQTVREWSEAAGALAEAVHRSIVVQPCDCPNSLTVKALSELHDCRLLLECRRMLQ